MIRSASPGRFGGAVAILSLLVAGAALAEDPVSAKTDKAADTSQSREGVETTAAAASQAEKAFEPPAGYLPKKRGNKIVYCKKDQEIGTRFPTEKCYDEDQLRDLELMREKNNRDFDQRRSLCTNPATCGSL